MTRARVTQVMGLLRLAPEIRRCILSIPETVGELAITERVLRPITQIDDREGQEEMLKMWSGKNLLHFFLIGGKK